ncbi:hypothetical protein HDV00_005444 [Rhizophlyctis rosea]|nr:hypothetical protein HDV00_005444 [Rhizophlyctis rosea]
MADRRQRTAGFVPLSQGQFEKAAIGKDKVGKSVGECQPMVTSVPEYYHLNNACRYINRTYFFDSDPPLGKLILAATAYLTGVTCPTKERYFFDDQSSKDVPVFMRVVPAVFGALTPVLVYLTLREMRLGVAAAVLAGLMVTFDNATILQSRLINADPFLLFFSVFATYSWVQFRKRRYAPFTFGWWLWLQATGIAIGLVAGTKATGLGTVLFILSAAAVDLWELLNPDRTSSLRVYSKQVFERAWALLIIPIAIYFGAFYAHFAILTHSGPGDAVHTQAFQAELIGNQYHAVMPAIAYNSTVSLKNRDGPALLHSCPDHYPEHYAENRVGSGGLMVSASQWLEDVIEHRWVIEPSGWSYGGKGALQEVPATTDHIQNGDIIRLRHKMTDSYLVTHDVVSPLTDTNMEITTVSGDDAQMRFRDTLWRVTLLHDPGMKGNKVKAKRSWFKLVNVEHKVGLHLNKDPLPDWAKGRWEVNGDKDAGEFLGAWSVNEIFDAPDVPADPEDVDLQPGKLSFISKFVELQFEMRKSKHRHRNTTTSLVEGLTIPGFMEPPPVSADTEEAAEGSFLLVVNPVVWAQVAGAVAVWCAVLGAEMILERRWKTEFLPSNVYRAFWRKGGFFILGWAWHFVGDKSGWVVGNVIGVMGVAALVGLVGKGWMRGVLVLASVGIVVAGWWYHVLGTYVLVGSGAAMWVGIDAFVIKRI